MFVVDAACPRRRLPSGLPLRADPRATGHIGSTGTHALASGTRSCASVSARPGRTWRRSTACERIPLRISGRRQPEFAFAPGERAPQERYSAIRTPEPGQYRAISTLDQLAYCRALLDEGYLAGFSREGSCTTNVLRISNHDPEILRMDQAALVALRLRLRRRANRRWQRPECLQHRGGLSERLRLLLGTNPAITRKRTYRRRCA